MVVETEGKSRWSIGKESIFQLLIGISAYIGLETLFIFLNLPIKTYFYVTFALVPSIAIPISFGAKYGPIVGFAVGFCGKFLTDIILYGGIWIWWPLGFGLMGLIPGLKFHKYYKGKYTEGRNLFKLSLYALVAAFFGTIIPSTLSIFSEQLGLFFPILFYSIPMFFIAAFNGVIITPLMARGLEYLDSKTPSIKSKETSSKESLHLNQAGVLLAGFCCLLSFGLFILKYVLNTEGSAMGCGAGAPFSHEIAGNIGLTLELGIYAFLALGIGISMALLIWWIYARKLRN
jgi:uncharacterized membrane protein